MSKVYLKNWRMSGTVKIEAETANEAEVKFIALTKQELAEDGELETDSATEEIAE